MSSTKIKEKDEKVWGLWEPIGEYLEELTRTLSSIHDSLEDMNEELYRIRSHVTRNNAEFEHE